jgi:hypothetical protein
LGYPATCAQARLFFAKKKLIRPAWLQWWYVDGCDFETYRLGLARNVLKGTASFSPQFNLHQHQTLSQGTARRQFAAGNARNRSLSATAAGTSTVWAFYVQVNYFRVTDSGALSVVPETESE